jgi:putative Ca2+/H+ antiporter (TMEM165/GDT1 family)
MSPELLLLGSTFSTVFLAELGDKTQLATMALSGSTDRPMLVFVGSASALVLASLVGALAGGSLAQLVPTDLLQLLAAAGFVVIGLRLLLGAVRAEPAAAYSEVIGGETEPHGGGRSAPASQVPPA